MARGSLHYTLPSDPLLIEPIVQLSNYFGEDVPSFFGSKSAKQLMTKSFVALPYFNNHDTRAFKPRNLSLD